MNVAQTNLQLYNQLQLEDWSDTDLISIKKAYNVSQQLFPNAYRPSQKPFICHLVGTASVLAHWQERPAMVTAGLLHSAYLYGKFGDKTSGATSARRQYLGETVGTPVEKLVYLYTSEKSNDPLISENRDYLVLSLADLYDELLDLGTVYAPAKTPKELEGGADHAVKAIIEAASRTINDEAGAQFQLAIQNAQQASVPEYLTTADAGSIRIKEGIPQFRKRRNRSILGRLLKGNSKH